MAWFTRFTRFADMHLVYGQEQASSCGPSSVMMCVAKLRKLSLDQAIYPEAEVRALYNKKNPGHQSDFLFDGASAEGLANTLNALGCGTWKWSNYSPDLLAAKVGVHSAISGPVISVEPVILGVRWAGINAGGHAVCVDTIREIGSTRYATVCDPYDANVHMQAFGTGPFIYTAKPAQFWDGPGKARHLNVINKRVVPQTIKHFDWPAAGTVGQAVIIVHRV